MGLLESRIREIESTLKGSVIVSSTREDGAQTIRVGALVLLEDVATGRELTYVLVGAREANPLQGKISDVSPVGRALVGRSAGQEVEVDSPRGRLHYRIVKVSR